MRRLCLLTLAAATLILLSVPQAQAATIGLAGFTTNNLPANDDGSTGLVNIGFNIDFFGTTFSSLYVNNNGNVTFNRQLGEYTPTGITAGSQPTMAPFWADVDTRGTAGPPSTQLVTYGNDTVGGRNAFGVDWIGVGYFSGSPTAARDSFQLVIVDRADVGAGDFDFMFNYDQIQWESGQASGSDANGCGGSPAHAGWTNGDGNPSHFSELAGSGVSGAFTGLGVTVGRATGGPNVLTTHSLNSDTAGRYLFNVRNGEVVPPTSVPEPASVLLLGTGLVAVAQRRFTRRGPA